MSTRILASNVRAQLEAAKDTVHISERILQSSEAILSADTPRGDQEDDIPDTSIQQTPIIAQATPQQTADHSTNVHNDITYVKHYLAQTQERLQHSNKQDPLLDSLDEKKIFNPREFYNNLEDMVLTEGDKVFVPMESVDHSTGILSKSVQEQIKASRDIMNKSTTMMDSVLRSKSVPNSRDGASSPYHMIPAASSPVPRPQSTPPHPRPQASTPPHSRPHSSTPPHSRSHSTTPPPSEDPDDLTQLRSIYRGKNNNSPSDSLDKILHYTNSFSSKYGKSPTSSGVITAQLNTNPTQKSNDTQTNNNTPPLSTPTPNSPKSRSSSSLSKPHFSIPPLTFPRSPSPITRLSFTSNTPANEKTNTSSTSPHVPPFRPRSASPFSSSAFALSSSTGPASAARPPLFSTTSQSSLSFKHISHPSLPVTDLSRLDVSAYPNTPGKTSSYPFPAPHPPTRPHSASSIPTNPTSHHHHHSPSTLSPSTSRYTTSHLPPKSHESNSITIAMAMALSSRERDEYVERIKTRNRSASMTSDSILDRFYSDRIAT